MPVSNERKHGGDASGAGVEMSQESASSQLRKSGDLATSAASLVFTSPVSGVVADGAGESTDDLNIRVLYLDDNDVTCAAWRTIPSVAALKEMLCEHNQNVSMSPSQRDTGDCFSKIQVLPSVGTPKTANAARPLPTQSIAEKTQSSSAFPAIQLSSNSSSVGDVHQAWISIKGATKEELAEILESLPVHVLTRRRIISVLSMGTDPCGIQDTESSDDGDSSSDAEGAESSDPCCGGGSHAMRAATVRDNFVEYFPAHGYAVLCLQAASVPKGESTQRGSIQYDGVSSQRTRLPCAPVVALAFESTLFTFSVDSFGGEGDVRLIVSHHAWPTGYPTGKGASCMQGRPPFSAGSAEPRVPVDSAHKGTEIPNMARCDPLSFDSENHETCVFSLDGGRAAKDKRGEAPCEAPRDTAVHRGEVPEPTAYSASAAAAGASAVTLPFPSAGRQTSEPQQPIILYGSPNHPPSPNRRAATAISVVCSSLVSAILAYLQQSTRVLLMEANQLDELVLQILPSRVDQDDMLVRTKNLRHLTAFFHMDALQKERVLKELLLPVMRPTPFSQSTQAVERYQRALSSLRSTILKLRKCRDIINMASMTLVSGVSSRLLSHCNFMDYLNHMQTRIALVVMPIAVIPGLFAMNVSVPFLNGETATPFYCIVGISVGLMLIGALPTVYKLFMYKAPGALATVE
ncbi:hypothetical protein JKF63_03617 [Porcisia hertigi]|uniref:Uncharacterized protein n=1 Tax=Porcisia hertigi TaxID=2761500 RepID=A0A836IH46_9TRYP|nr:hypothetical protein JKF63_03617 [Porcisia hertigi]